MKWVILTLLSILMYLPGLLLRYLPFARLYSLRQKKILFGVQGALLFMNAVFFYVIGIQGDMGIVYGKFIMFLFGVLSTGVNILILRSRWRELLFTCGFSLLVAQCVMHTMVYGMRRTIGFDGVDDYFVGMLLFFLLFIITFPVWLKMLQRSVTAFLDMEGAEYWKMVWFIPIGMFFTCYVATPSEMYAETVFQLLSHYLMLVTAAFVCHCVARDVSVLQMQLKMERRLSMQEEYYTQLAEQVERARKSRHDFKHHIMAIREYIKQDDKEGMSLYADRLLERSTEEAVIPYTGNSAVDGVIYHYALLAKKHGIKFYYPAVCRNHGMQDMDFCVLLGNALDNAVEGCLTVAQDRFIKVILDEDGVSVRLMISNSFDGNVQEKDGRMLSRKRDNRPGVGMASMRSICEKYGVVMDCRYDEKVFQLLFIFMKEG